MNPILMLLFGSGLREQIGADPVALSDIEERLRSLSNGARDAVLSSKRNTVAAGVLSAVVTVAGAYLHGRRRGRRRATVLEVERR